MTNPARLTAWRPLSACLLAGIALIVCQTTDVRADDKSKPAAGDWPQFLGPNRNGISAEKGLLKAWRADGGVGMSGLSISGGRLVTLAHRDGRQAVLVLDALTGKEIRTVPFAPVYRNSMGAGPRATPAIVGDTAYCFSGEGILLAVDFKSGKVNWQHDVLKELGGKPVDYGMAASPLVVGKLVILTAGARNATVVAYDRQSGKLAWKAGSDRAGYSSPVLLKVGGKPQIVAYTGESVLGLSPETGRQLWRHPYETDYDCNIAAPLAVDGKVFISSGENHGCSLLSLTPKKNVFAVSEIWSSHGPRSVMRNEWQTLILLNGYLYGMDNVGGAGPVTHFTCVKAATGEKVWEEKRFGKGNLIAADGKLFMSTIKGELVIARASPAKYIEISRMPVTGATRQAPSLAGGLLYLRNDKQIVCIDVRAK